MSIFEQKISITELLHEIPSTELQQIAVETKVDHYSKELHGKWMFYLLLYALLRIDRLSQRGLADVFSSPLFRFLFNYQSKKKKISHSSLSERLSVIQVEFFYKAYELIYKRFSSLYTKEEIAGMYLQRVDSTLIKDCSGKLQAGITCGNDYKKWKMIKCTINFDGMFGTFFKVHMESKYTSESLALPENVLGHCKKTKNHACIYIMDRGQGSLEAFSQMNQTEELNFVGRLLNNRKRKLIKDNTAASSQTPFTHGELREDSLVQLYKMEKTVGKNGQETRKPVLVEETFRIIRFQPKAKKEEIVLITNMLSLSADEVASIYKRRWDIEVFFRFLKQELNFSHLISLNKNGIEVILLMTLITAMLVMIYKKENEIGYKTAVRRMQIELESFIVTLIVHHCGGDIKKIDFTYP
jgi:hypothetical protein